MTSSGLYQISTSSNGNVETRLVEIKSLLGATADAGATGSTAGLLPRLLSLIGSLDGLESSLGDANASPAANTLQARLKSSVDLLTTINTSLAAQKSPVSATTTPINVVPAGTQLVGAAGAGVLYRRVTLQIDSGTDINVFTAGNITGSPRIKGMPLGVAYVLDYLGAIFASTATAATVNVTVDTY